MFPGFFRPKNNYFRLPNDWFDTWIDIRHATKRTRILAPLKVTEYTIKWTWGYQNYDDPVRISRHDFQYGKLFGSQRLDRGTNLSNDGLEKSLEFLLDLGVIEEQRQEEHRPLFLPRLRSKEQDTPGFLGGNVIFPEETRYPGFARPESNYFQVPAIWTDLTHDVTSEAQILATEYFFRHTWGWHGNGDEARWMNVDDVANGRRYRSDERRGERYDRGIGYSERSVRDALNAGVKLGWLVWRTKEQRKEYALHLEGMHASDEGEFLDTLAKAPATAPAPEPLPPTPPKIEVGDNVTTIPPLKDTDNTKDQTEIAQLRLQVAKLTETVNSLLRLLHTAGFDVEIQGVFSEKNRVTTEANRVPTEANRVPAEANGVSDGSKQRAYYTDTGSDTGSKTPPPDTPARTTATNSDDGDNDQNVGGGVITSSVKSLINRLTSLETPMSPDAASRLISTYEEQPVRAWLDVLEHDPTVRSVPALLIHKLRAGETPPSKPRRNHRRDGIFRKPPAEEIDEETQKRQVAALEELQKRQAQKRAEAEKQRAEGRVE